MNQILQNKDINTSFPSNTKLDLLKKGKFFKILFFSCFILAILSTIYYAYYLFDHNQKEQLSKQLVDNFTITRLYHQENSYETSTMTTNLENETTSFSVIGLIEISNININYPILSDISEELLKIAPCKFYGPMPNEVGNLCIAGHNYNNYKFFSRLKKLNMGDNIYIYDLSGKKLTYTIYDSYETDADDFSCVNQNTNGKKEVTLITCNNIKNKRRVIKATQKG